MFLWSGIFGSCVVSDSNYGGWLKEWGHVGRMFLWRPNSCLWRAKMMIKMMLQLSTLSSFLYSKDSFALFCKAMRRTRSRFVSRVVCDHGHQKVYSSKLILHRTLPVVPLLGLYSVLIQYPPTCQYWRRPTILKHLLMRTQSGGRFHSQWIIFQMNHHMNGVYSIWRRKNAYERF